jgi:hypothetical protein
MNIKVIDLLENMSDFGNRSVRNDYSGRGMYGKTCLGIVCDNPIHIIEEAAQRGLLGAKIDSMGQDSIVYWPCYNEESEVREVELVDCEPKGNSTLDLTFFKQ